MLGSPCHLQSQPAKRPHPIILRRHARAHNGWRSTAWHRSMAWRADAARRGRIHWAMYYHRRCFSRPRIEGVHHLVGWAVWRTAVCGGCRGRWCGRIRARRLRKIETSSRHPASRGHAGSIPRHDRRGAPHATRSRPVPPQVRHRALRFVTFPRSLCALFYRSLAAFPHLAHSTTSIVDVQYLSSMPLLAVTSTCKRCIKRGLLKPPGCEPQ